MTAGSREDDSEPGAGESEKPGLVNLLELLTIATGQPLEVLCGAVGLRAAYVRRLFGGKGWKLVATWTRAITTLGASVVVEGDGRWVAAEAQTPIAAELRATVLSGARSTINARDLGEAARILLERRKPGVRAFRRVAAITGMAHDRLLDGKEWPVLLMIRQVLSTVGAHVVLEADDLRIDVERIPVQPPERIVMRLAESKVEAVPPLQSRSPDVQQIVKMLRRGASHAEVARQMGVSERNVTVIANEYGIRRSWRVQQIVEMLRTGAGQMDVAREAGVSRQRVNRIAVEYGIRGAPTRDRVQSARTKLRRKYPLP